MQKMTAPPDTTIFIPPGLRMDAPPEDGSQIVAWAIDLHGMGFNEPADEARWVIAQFAPSYRGGKPYWSWSVPGRVTSVKVLGWLPLPCKDLMGRYATWEVPNV
jgi:hypothetical protein